LTKSAHFIPFRVGQSTEVLARRYLEVIIFYFISFVFS
jgi:hypothetical protein